MSRIVSEVCKQHRVSTEGFYGPRRFKPLVLARWEAVWRIRQVRRPNGAHRYSYGVIAAHMKRDPSTIRHAYASAVALRVAEPEQVR